MFLLIAIASGAGADDISVSVCLYLLEASSVSVYLYLLEAFSVICKDSDSSRLNNASISFILLELVLVPFCSLHYTCFVSDR